MKMTLRKGTENKYDNKSARIVKVCLDGVFAKYCGVAVSINECNKDSKYKRNNGVVLSPFVDFEFRLQHSMQMCF